MRSTPATGSLRRTPSSLARVEEAGIVWIGPPPEAIEAMGSKIAARERMRAAGVPVVPGTTMPATSVEDVLAAAERRRLPDRRQGVGRRRREGDARRSLRRRGRACLRELPARGRGVLRGLGRLRRALPRGSAARRGPGPRRLPRQRRSPRRARLHDPAAASEARRGDAVACGRRRAPRAHRDDRDRRRSRGRLSIRGNDRGPARRRRCVLLPRDEHARAGGAHRHRGRDWDRHRARADPCRGRGAAVRDPGRRRASRSRHRMPDQRRGRDERVSFPRRGGSRPTGSLRASACAWTRASGRATRSRSSTIR